MYSVLKKVSLLILREPRINSHPVKIQGCEHTNSSKLNSILLPFITHINTLRLCILRDLLFYRISEV